MQVNRLFIQAIKKSIGIKERDKVECITTFSVLWAPTSNKAISKSLLLFGFKEAQAQVLSLELLHK